MKLKRQKLADYIVEHSRTVASSKKLAREVAATLLHERQTDQLDSLLRDVGRLRANYGHLEVTVVSAHELSHAALDDIKTIIQSEFPKAKSIQISTRLDGDVVGGFRLEMPDEQLDMTIRRRLAKFRHLTDAIKE